MHAIDKLAHFSRIKKERLALAFSKAMRRWISLDFERTRGFRFYPKPETDEDEAGHAVGREVMDEVLHPGEVGVAPGRNAILQRTSSSLRNQPESLKNSECEMRK